MLVSDHTSLSREELEEEVLRLRTQLRGTSIDAARQSAVFDSALDFAMVVTDREGIITAWNTGAEHVMGWTAAEMCGRDAARFFTPEDRASGRVAHEMDIALRDRRASDERWHLRKGDERFWASGEMMPLRDGNDQHVGFLKIIRDRTAEHLAGVALKETQERYRIVSRATNDAVWDWNFDTDRVLWNEVLECAYGHPAATVEPTASWRMARIHPEDRTRIEASIQAVVDGAGTAWTDEYRFQRVDGSYAEVLDRGHVIRDKAGHAMRMIGAMLDLTRLRNAEADLRTSKERFQTILNTIDAAFAIVEVKFDADDRPVDYRFIEANPAFERQAGVDLSGKWVSEFAPNLERFWFDTYGHVAMTGEPANFESYAEAFERWFDVRAVRIGNPAERQIAILFSDVTERHAAGARLRASEAVARENIERVQNALAAGAIIGTWSWDLPTDRFTVDEAFARAFGLDPTLSRDGIPLDQIVATVHPDDQAGLADAMNQAITRGGAYAHQYRTRRADGNYYWLEANGHVTRSPDGTPLSFPGVLLDVEERRAIEGERDRAAADLRALNETLEQHIAERTAELMHAEEQLRQSQKMEAIGQLTGGVAHDFNNLLTVIRGSVDLLRRPGISEERRDRYISAIADTADRATKLTGQLLAFARRQALKPEVFDVGGNLSALREMIGSLVGSRIQIALKAPSEPCFIDTDPSQFDTAIVNMVVNARDAMAGTGDLVLSIGTAREVPATRAHLSVTGDFVTVSIADNGSGIAEDNLARIFEPFYTTKGVGEGTGLGLSQVFGFAKQSGGDVIAQSEVGRGTTFTLYLPRVAHGPDVVAASGDPTELSQEDGTCVLVVEDNPDVGRFATSTLAELGYATVYASSAAAALAELEKDADRFDVIFSDVVMPGMSGLELASLVRDRYPQLPVVLTSGYSHVLAEEGSSGFDLLHKPYSIDQLSRTLMRAVR